MRDQMKHFPVNWADGMKINKTHFIAQDDATRSSLHEVASIGLSPVRYGVLPASVAGENTFVVNVTVDNQNTVRVAVLSCHAFTPGGIRIAIPALGQGLQEADGVPAVNFPLAVSGSNMVWWAVLIVNPFERQPTGSPDLTENPPRFPSSAPTYTVEVVSDTQFKQYANHPYAIAIGKIVVNGSDIRVDDEYIPPCISISAHPDLESLLHEIDQFFGNLENRCSLIVQKIYRKSQNQGNDLGELVQFLCDRMLLHLGQAITSLRWTMLHESPVSLFAALASLSRVIKNTIDLRIGSGKEEMMNYLSDWCELKQGELETLLSGMASMRFDNNDVNANIHRVIQFVKVTDRLFDTLSKLEYIGKRKESGIFVKEEKPETQEQKARRRFFG